MPNIPEIQQFQMPNVANTAFKFLQLRMLQDQAQNTALEQQRKIQEEQRKIQEEQKAVERTNSIESNSFALNLLAGVNSPEDLDVAKSLFLSRYPQQGEMVGKLLPTYDPQLVNMIRNSLRTETQRMKKEEEDSKITAYSAGSSLYQGGKALGQVPFSPEKSPAPQFEVFENPGGDQVYVEKGKTIPEGYTKVQAKGTQVTIQTGDLGKTTKAKLEQDIIEGTQNIQSFKETRKLFKPEYLTIFGKSGKLLAETADKIGISTKGQRVLIRERSKWFRQAKADFIGYRKWATGVAGGEKELKEIATSFPDPVNNSPTQYKANLGSIEETTKRVLMLNTDFLRSGIDINQSLDKVLEQAKRVGIQDPSGGTGNNDVIIRFDAQGNRVQSP